MNTILNCDFLRPRFLPDLEAQAEWGGKGATLARLIKRGFAVPPTAAMGVTQIRMWLELLPEYRPAMECWHQKGVHAATQALEMLENAILTSPMPEHWPLSVATIRKFLCGDEEGDLDCWPLIFRSSMGIEDGSHASFSGSFESIVCREPKSEAVWKALTQVIASAFRISSAQTIASSGADPLKLSVGVVIQPFLIAQISGHATSCHPANPWDRVGWIEWIKGQGDALAQGVSQTQNARQSDHPLPEVAPFWESLWKRVLKAEKILKSRVEVEWIWDGLQLWIVQARPLATEEARLAVRHPGRLWSRLLSLERFPEPITPMGWSSLQETLRANLESLDRRFGIIAKSPEEMAIRFKGVIYSDPDFFGVRWSRYLNPLRFENYKILGSLAAALFRMIVRIISRPSHISSLVSKSYFILDAKYGLLKNQAIKIETTWDQHCSYWVTTLNKFKLSLKVDPLAQQQNSQILLKKMTELGQMSCAFMEPDLAIFLIKDQLSSALRSFCKSLGWDDNDCSDLFRGFSGNRTSQMNDQLQKCLHSLRGDPNFVRFVEQLSMEPLQATLNLSPVNRQFWNNFLTENGHLTTSWDVAVPSWGENPSQLVPIIKLTHKENGEALKASLQKRNASRSRLKNQLNKLRFLKADQARIFKSLDSIEAMMRMDEEHHFLSGLLLVLSRILIEAGAKNIVDRNIIVKMDDVYFLEIGELKSLLSHNNQTFFMGDVVNKRRLDFFRFKDQSNTPNTLPWEKVNKEQGQLIMGDDSWIGQPMSPGTAEGRAIVADHLSELANLEPGAILVTTSPNPTLTPAFSILGGIISVTGGALSHGFVSAREFALPAVSGLPGITKKIATGDRLRIDGTTGRVEVLK